MHLLLGPIGPEAVQVLHGFQVRQKRRRFDTIMPARTLIQLHGLKTMSLSEIVNFWPFPDRRILLSLIQVVLRIRGMLHQIGVELRRCFKHHIVDGHHFQDQSCISVGLLHLLIGEIFKSPPLFTTPVEVLVPAVDAVTG